ncbi:hypothetical protein R1flu_008252 [Riccia fluitans]|uniref:Uncharacterized protein n=1 Tax=Riccia fluitans TaxID=41844 RepID=A0ABD1YEA0_9MARC
MAEVRRPVHQEDSKELEFKERQKKEAEAAAAAREQKCQQILEAQRVVKEDEWKKAWGELKSRLEKVILDNCLDSVASFECEELQQLRAEFNLNGQGMTKAEKDLIVQLSELQDGIAELKTQKVVGWLIPFWVK